MKHSIPFLDLKNNYKQNAVALNKAFFRVMKSGRFLLGNEVVKFENQFAAYLGVPHAIGVASGTDALSLSLHALGVRSGDEVIIPANSYPTAFAIASIGAIPRFVDVSSKTHTINTSLIEECITKKTKVIMPVHLYGQSSDMDPILFLAKKHKLFVVEDVAQAHGAEYKGKKLGTLGDIGCFSFYPTKNMGTFGDGGAIVTRKKNILRSLLQLRMYGEEKRYHSLKIATHSRLDELQAGFLQILLKRIDHTNRKRQKRAAYYIQHLRNLPIKIPEVIRDKRHVYHLFVIQVRKREKVRRFLQQNGVETAIHYPTPIHLVPAFSYLGYKKGDFPVSEELAKTILSLPLYPTLSFADIKTICNLIKQQVQ